jgi:hypothetical protein
MMTQLLQDVRRLPSSLPSSPAQQPHSSVPTATPPPPNQKTPLPPANFSHRFRCRYPYQTRRVRHSPPRTSSSKPSPRGCATCPSAPLRNGSSAQGARSRSFRPRLTRRGNSLAGRRRHVSRQEEQNSGLSIPSVSSHTLPFFVRTLTQF